MKKLIQWLYSVTFVRFVMVGVVNTVVGMAIMFGGYNLLRVPYWPDTARYWLFSALGYVLSSLMSFFLNKSFTFRSKEKMWPEFWRFGVVIAICYGIAYGAARPLVQSLLSGQSKSLQDNVAYVAGAVIFTLLNFAGQRLFAFRKKQITEIEQEIEQEIEEKIEEKKQGAHDDND
ncbi:MAG: GtrA family protein [Firmicutes bacterium]|nr:GtrA family protein [Bacillota bacterium]